MSSHRYVLHATETYLEEYTVFPPNQCVFVVQEEDSPVFRGSFSVPTLAGTQDSTFLNSSALQNVYNDLDDDQTKQIKEMFEKFKINLSLVSEIKKGIADSDLDDKIKKLLQRNLTDRMTPPKEAFPYALDEKIRFAGVSIHNSSYAVPSGSLVEVPTIVQGVATIFPRPGDIPACERYVPGEIYSETIPIYKRLSESRVEIGRILDFPNPHSLRVAINIANQPP